MSGTSRSSREADDLSLSAELDAYSKFVNAWLDQAKRETAAVQRLQKAVATGNLRDIDKLRQAAQTATETAGQRAAECPSFEFDATAYLTQNGAFLRELIEAAEKAGVRLSERDGVIFSFPLLLRPEPNSTAVRIDKKLVPTLRPETLAAILKQAQGKEPKSRPQQFIETLYEAYELVRAQRRIDAYIDQPLIRLYEVLTILPGRRLLAARLHPRPLLPRYQ
jgi:hypothetical protein